LPSTCAEEVCPVTPGLRRISWELPDPKNLPLEQVRAIREEVQRHIEELLHELDQKERPPRGSQRALRPLSGWARTDDTRSG
jgi:hypothetical protein